MGNYLVSSSPHIFSPRTTRNIMLDVIIALIPCVIASVLIFGFYPLVTVLICVASAVLAEFLFNSIRKKPQTVNDLSAVVTGIILGLNLPPTVPFYVPIVGSFFAIMVVKMLFGGIGKNFANPAITARIFLMLCWSSIMTKYVVPINLSQGLSELFTYLAQELNITTATTSATVNAITSATPLGGIKSAIEAGTNPAYGLSALDMFLGKIGGSAGEVSTLAVLIGGIYLAIRKVIDVKIPIIYIGTTALFTAIFYANTGYVGEYVWTYLLGGGLVFGAVFMATDYSTTPNTNLGKIIFALGCGFLTVILRKFSSMVEGVSFAILLMNIVSPLIERIVPKPFGHHNLSLKEIIEAKKSVKTQKAGKGGSNE
ncbi:MAG TPA: RnfABCDGE type electron transport complex subunit D [Clostridia bacterium]|nr:RnfABCDGE type electron transport complex subunit D [Clostridia bacterium]